MISKIYGELKVKKTIIKQITDCIEQVFDRGGRELCKRIIIYPCGEVGIQAYNIMKNIYSIEPAYIIDNRKCKYTDNIKGVSFLKDLDTSKYILFLTSKNLNIYKELKDNIIYFFQNENIIELECMKSIVSKEYPEFKTKIGKYSYGKICTNHRWIESIGSFCSFGDGTDYVTNHEMRYITTHPIIYDGKSVEGYEYPFRVDSEMDYYMEGIEPNSEKIKNKEEQKSEMMCGLAEM